MSASRRVILLAGVLCALAAASPLGAAAEMPAPGIEEFSAVPSTSQAGGHPDVHLQIQVEGLRKLPGRL